jgi:lipopolysaccharide transport system ATP-binding protein
MVRELCDDALWLDHGRLQKIGSSDEVVRAYSDDAVQETILRNKFQETTGPMEDTAGMRRIGSREVELASVDVMSSQRKVMADFRCGEPVRVEISYFAQEAVRDPVFVVSITEEDGRVRFKAATGGALSHIPLVKGRGRLSLRIQDLHLTPGKYYVDVGVYEKEWRYAYDYCWRVHLISFRHDLSGGNGASARNPRVDWTIA